MAEPKCYNPLDILLDYQRDWLITGQKSMYMIGLMARQVGKSLMCMAEAVHDCNQIPNTTWVCLSTTERQSGEMLLKAKQWAEAFLICAPEKLKGWLSYTCTASEIKFGNGSRIISVPATENSRGWTGNVILDEFALHRDGGYKIWRAATGIATSKFGGNKKIRVISTPSSKNTKFYDLWSRDNIYVKKLITLPDAIAQGLPTTEDEIKATLDDLDMYSIEFLCQFADASTAAFASELLIRQSKDLPIGLTNGERYIGYDVARSGDKSVICTLIKRGTELYVESLDILKNTPYNDQLRILAGKLKGVSKCLIDSTGIGSMVAEEARRINGAKVEGYKFTQESKAALMNGLHKALDTSTLWIPDRKDVRDDIASMDKIVTNTGAISYQARHTRDGHADICCALALAVKAAGTHGPVVMPVSIPFNSVM